MKTIAYIDKVEGKTLMAFKIINDNRNNLNLYSFKRINRIQEALKELKHMGNIDIYYIKGNKKRLLFSKGLLKMFNS